MGSAACMVQPVPETSGYELTTSRTGVSSADKAYSTCENASGPNILLFSFLAASCICLQSRSNSSSRVDRRTTVSMQDGYDRGRKSVTSRLVLVQLLALVMKSNEEVDWSLYCSSFVCLSVHQVPVQALRMGMVTAKQMITKSNHHCRA